MRFHFWEETGIAKCMTYFLKEGGLAGRKKRFSSEHRNPRQVVRRSSNVAQGTSSSMEREARVRHFKNSQRNLEEIVPKEIPKRDLERNLKRELRNEIRNASSTMESET